MAFTIVDPSNTKKKKGVVFSKGTYDVKTQTYTDPKGNKSSMDISNAKNIGATIVLSGGLGGGGSKPATNTGGSSYVDTKTGIGYEVSSTGSKSYVPTATEQQKIQNYNASQTALYQNAIVQSAKDKYNRNFGYQAWDKANAYQKNQYIKEAYNKLSPQFEERVNRYSTETTRESIEKANAPVVSYETIVNKPTGFIGRTIERISEKKADLEIQKPFLSDILFGTTLRQQAELGGGRLLAGYPPPIIPAFSTSGFIFTGTSKVGRSGKLINTNIKFVTDKGKVGGLSAISRIVKIKGNTFLLQTTSKGAYISKGVEYPTGILFTKLNSPFISRGVSASKNINNLITQIAIGKTAKTGFRLQFLSTRNPYVNIKSFISGSKGLQKGDFVTILGTTKTNTGLTYAGGLLKITKPSGSGGVSFIKYISKGNSLAVPVTTAVQNQIATNIQGAIAGSINTGESLKVVSATATTLSNLPKVEGTTTEVRVITTTQSPVLMQRETTKTLQIPIAVSTTGLGSRSITRQIVSQNEVQQTIQIPIAVTQQRNIPAQIYLQKTSMMNILKLPAITTTYTNKPIIPIELPKIKKSTGTGLGSFGVYVRRFGTFNIVGTARTFSNAFNIGKQKVRTTLGATFKVTGSPQYFNTPAGFYTKYSKKEGTLFIEKPKYRLNTGTELKEIQYYKKLKGGII